MAKATGAVLVTGGNRGLGLEVCRQLGRLGMRVLLTARDIAEGAKATAALRAEGLDVIFEPLDVTSRLVWAATLPPDGPSGGFFRDRQSIPW